MRILGFKIFEKKKPILSTHPSYRFDMVASGYFERYYMAKHKRTFKRIQEDIQKKYKEISRGRKAIITVRPYIEIRELVTLKGK